MPTFRIDATIPRLEVDKWVRVAEKQMNEVMRGTARAFLVTALRRIPVRTGFLAGAFGTLEDAIGAAFSGETGQRQSKKSLSKRQRELGQNVSESHLNQTTVRNKNLRDLKRLERLRKEREAKFKELEQLRQRELHRRTEIHERIRQAHADKGYPLTAKEHETALANIRNESLKERATREKLLNEISKGRQEIGKLAEHVERTFNPERAAQLDRINAERLKADKKALAHGLEFEDKVSKYKEGEHRSQLLKERNFHDRIRKILDSFEHGRITEQRRDQLLSDARANLDKPTTRQSKLTERVNNIIIKRAEKLPKAALERLKTKFIREARKRLESISGLTSGERAAALKQEVTTRLLERLSKITQRSQFQQIAHQASTKSGFELLSHQTAKDLLASTRAKDASGTQINRLNTLARVSSRQDLRDEKGRYAGSIPVTRIRRLDDIRHGEIIRSFLNNKRTFTDKSGHEKTVIDNIFREYYYPVVGQRSQRILKTPRSGRRFATPATGVIIGNKALEGGSENAGLFEQLAKQLGAAGIPLGQVTSGGTTRISPGLKAGLEREINSLKRLPTHFVFNYEVNIAYLQANETARGGWLAWTAATMAAFQYLQTHILQAVPDLGEYIINDKVYLNNNSIKRSRT